MRALPSASAAAHAKFCTKTLRLQATACLTELQDDLASQTAVCINFADGAARAECFHGLGEMRRKGAALCREQKAARKDYRPGVGLFLEVPLDDPTNVLRLVACNVDPRCATLPQP